TLLPKRADAHALGDFRPISLIHLVAKIFAKVLSLRLAPKLNTLVSTSQNAFIPGRSLHDNFILVRQSAHLLHQLGAPRALLKLDLARAFDSVRWPFLFDALSRYGFGSRFLDWLAILFSSASTRVLINGEPGPAICTDVGSARATPFRPSSSYSPSTHLDAFSTAQLSWVSCNAFTLGDRCHPSPSMRMT
uniref:Reverse transcriptase domain-containing protein n=1 Tax=Aegilops tauschii subsp. strangulata TaxID=200361 RepID=A0A452Y0V1_AEGTS